MTKEEIVDLRKKTVQRVERLRGVGDHSAEAPDIRMNAEVILQLLDHLLERMR